MRVLVFGVAAYLLIAAVACQPLREAKAELELSRRSYRKPSRTHAPKAAGSKVKRVSDDCILSILDLSNRPPADHISASTP